MMWGNMWNMANVGWGWMALGWLWMVVFWGAIIWLVVWAVGRLTQGQRPAGQGPTPLEITQARYARGEITREQYEQLKRDLM
ncbi:MAG: SHOCT domain-containing protein [Chloroflexi bacterium]|nr:SHOCT domain-containing protein [Chloroflexota bacterium]